MGTTERLEVKNTPKTPKEKPRAGRTRSGIVDRQTLFLEALGELGYVKHAAKVAGIARKTPYNWLKTDPEFVARYKDAIALATESAEDEMRRRALIGVFEPNVFQGRFVYPQEEVEIEPAVLDRRGRVIQPARTEWRDKPGARPLGIRRYSDQLLMFWLRAYKPERYRPAASLELSGPETGPIEIVERLNAARARMRKEKESDAGPRLTSNSPAT
jgi:hypothetical protein